ncbi:MAG TPA: MOSC domain-containing protein [Leucothrix mucor]|nr:MOSC domain-containing protein [Leucothrix mucor]
MTNSISVSSLIIYPVKSLAGITVDSSELDSMGLKNDRRWMLVSPQGDFLSQRKMPKMALIQPRFVDDQLILSSKNHTDFTVPTISSNSPQRMVVNIWKDSVNALRVGDDADSWLSTVLGMDCHLVYIPDDEIRQCDPEFAKQGEHTGFADAFPLLLISVASLDDLNSRLKHPVEMRRFRPNIVVSGCEAFAEDSWEKFTIGKLPLRGVKPCSRCILTTVNPDTGERDGNEPLQTLMTYRKQDNNVYFGQNVIHEQKGRIAIGDPLIVLPN